MDLADFQKLKDTLSKKDQKNNQLIGAKKSILESLKEDYGLKSLDEAEKELKKRRVEYSGLEEELEEMINELLKNLKEEGIIDEEY